MTDYNRVSQYVPERSAYNETLNYMKNHMKFSKDNCSVFENPFYNIRAHEDLNSVISDTDNLKREHIEFLNGQYDKSTRPDKYRFPLIIKMYYLILNNPHTQGKFVNENNTETFIMFTLQDVMDKFDTYQNIVPVLVEALKDLEKIIQEQNKKLEEIDVLKQEIERLKSAR